MIIEHCAHKLPPVQRGQISSLGNMQNLLLFCRIFFFNIHIVYPQLELFEIRNASLILSTLDGHV